MVSWIQKRSLRFLQQPLKSNIDNQATQQMFNLALQNQIH